MQISQPSSFQTTAGQACRLRKKRCDTISRGTCPLSTEAAQKRAPPASARGAGRSALLAKMVTFTASAPLSATTRFILSQQGSTLRQGLQSGSSCNEEVKGRFHESSPHIVDRLRSSSSICRGPSFWEVDSKGRWRQREQERFGSLFHCVALVIVSLIPVSRCVRH